MKESTMQLEIQIDDLVYQEVMHYVNKSDFEVSGLGKVVIEKGGEGETILRVIKAIILPQVNTSVHTEIDPAAIGKAEYELRNTPGELRWWWHSHQKMPAFWSNEDLATIAELSKHDWFCATVFNQDEETLSAFAQAAPVRLMVDELLTYSFRNIPDDLTGTWDKLYEANVKNRKMTHWSDYAGMDAKTGDLPFEDADEPVARNPGMRVRRRKKQDIDITDAILEAAIDAGFSEEDAEDYVGLAERLLEDGRYSASAIEHAIVQKVLAERPE